MILDGIFAIGVALGMGDGEVEAVKRRAPMTDRITADEVLAARLNALERRIEQLESWTGADEDGDWLAEETSVSDQLLAQDTILMNMLWYLEMVLPGFSIAELRKRILDGEEYLLERCSETLTIPASDVRAWHERMCRIIADRLPSSVHDEPPGKP